MSLRSDDVAANAQILRIATQRFIDRILLLASSLREFRTANDKEKKRTQDWCDVDDEQPCHGGCRFAIPGYVDKQADTDDGVDCKDNDND